MRGSSATESLFWEESDDRWSIGTGENVSKQFGTIEGYIATVETDADSPDSDNDGSGVGSFWVKDNGSIFVRAS